MNAVLAVREGLLGTEYKDLFYICSIKDNHIS